MVTYPFLSEDEVTARSRFSDHPGSPASPTLACWGGHPPGSPDRPVLAGGGGHPITAITAITRFFKGVDSEQI